MEPHPLFRRSAIACVWPGKPQFYSCLSKLSLFPFNLQAVNIVGNYLFCFGGTTGWEYNNLVHRLDLESRVWKLVADEDHRNAPAQRFAP
jgi:hypothetical protein